MNSTLRRLSREIKIKANYYRGLYSHPHTPRLSKWLLWLALAYTMSPIDIIPDFIPILGHLDDIVIVPVLIALALWIIPEEVKFECARAQDLGAVHPKYEP